MSAGMKARAIGRGAEKISTNEYELRKSVFNYLSTRVLNKSIRFDNNKLYHHILLYPRSYVFNVINDYIESTRMQIIIERSLETLDFNSLLVLQV